ncbi:DUF2510 domain-containing protein [Mycobacterium sp. Marseille-P9652]|uniref:DUF2510 domain-containing protein n=1 Tax=Mycobacterium sp. Marseille-P9652 TaxID=2654950 RepID=UPI0012E8E0E4|nr:DUF2510 domain-containing protein [Mycobacterium sp. Marseille-P9652]
MTDPYRRFSVTLCKHTGAVILWHHQRYTFTGTLEQCEAEYRRAQTHCLLAGWWSLVSALVMNWVALISNFSAIRGVRRLAAQPPGAYPAAPQARIPQAVGPQATPPAGPPPPGWYGDPAGPGQRYWDGMRWTHWTHPPSPGPYPS